MVRSINSAPGNASPSTFGSTLLHIPAGITPQGRPLCAHVFSLCFLHFDGLHSLHLVRRWLQVRTPMQTLRFELSPLHFCSPPPHRNTSDSRTTVEPNAEGKTCNDELSTSSPLWRVPLTRTLYFCVSMDRADSSAPSVHVVHCCTLLRNFCIYAPIGF